MRWINVLGGRATKGRANGYTKGNRKFLNYDLEALNAFLKTRSLDHVFVTFQDSEGFDSSLLSDLISLLK